MIKTILSTLLLAAGLQAAPILTLDQNNITAPPNGVATWMFQLQADSVSWVSITSSFLMLESNPLLGIYTDEIGLLGGPSGRLAPGAPNWSGTVGYYLMDAASLIGDRNEATLRITYEQFSADPSTCGGCLLSSSSSDFPVSVEVISDVPEPGTWAMFLAGAGMIGMRYRRRI